MRFLVMGAGAIGSVFGGFLAKAGEDVTLVGREPHIAAIRQRGLKINGIWGEHGVQIERAVTSTARMTGETFDVVLICVKSYDTAQAVGQIAPLIHDTSLVVSLQNGLGNIEAIAERVGWERTLGGRVIFGVEVVQPAWVRVTVYAEEVMLGAKDERVARNRIEPIVACFNGAGIPTLFTTEIEKFIWSKVLYNAALNPLSTILRSPYGYLLENEGTREIMRMIVEEIFAVAKARSVALFWNEPHEYIDLLFGRLIPATAQHHPSMLQDILKNKPTEIDAINAAICHMGDECDVPTPINDFLCILIKALETAPRS
jgi:2-dehydropantoate 2-reductase